MITTREKWGGFMSEKDLSVKINKLELFLDKEFSAPRKTDAMQRSLLYRKLHFMKGQLDMMKKLSEYNIKRGDKDAKNDRSKN